MITLRRVTGLAALALCAMPLTGCGILIPLAIAAAESAPELIRDYQAAQVFVPTPAPVHHDDGPPLIEPDDVKP